MVEPAMVEHFELAQGARGTPPEVELCPKSNRVVKLSRVQSSIDQSFIRLSSDSFPDLEGEQIRSLYDHCLAAHRSEDFYLNAATNQWVRTSIACDSSDPQELFCSLEGSSNLTIQSNVLPCDPFLTKLDPASKRIHFPCSLLMDAYNQNKSLMEKLLEWRETQECELSRLIHGSENSVGTSFRLFWEIQDGVEDIKEYAKGSDGTVWLVKWKGGRFVRKELWRGDSDNDAELNVTEKLSHPHIIYSFGVSFATDTDRSSLFMEYMQYDLSALIVELFRKNGSDTPPFAHQDSLDILLQTAEAMEYMHGENVVHGDLKCLNILVSEFSVSSNATKYLVKVADFGSARSIIESQDFEPGAGTTNYAAPEALRRQSDLRRRSDRSVIISHPKLIDVYSFGIIAFEVLTGEKLYPEYKEKPTDLKKAIIGGTTRPPLREKCKKVNFLQDNALLSLIERCWDGEPSKRPSFSDVIKVLDSVKGGLQNSPSQGDHGQRSGKRKVSNFREGFRRNFARFKF